MNELVSSGFCEQRELDAFKSYFSFDIEPFIKPVSFKTNDVIIFEGVEPSSLYYLFSGKAKLYLTKANGKTVLIRFINAPSFIGEVELLGDEKEALSIKALERCRCFSVPLGALQQRLLGDAVFLRKMTSYLLRVSSESTEKIAGSSSFPLKNRLASFILSASTDGRYRVRHTEAADYLGVSYRHLLFVFGEFVSAGVLKKEKGGFEIQDRAALRALEQQME